MSEKIKSSEITDKKTYLNRRLFMRAAVLASTATASTVLYRKLNPRPIKAVEGEKLNEVAKVDNSAALKEGFFTDEKLTPKEAITNYNNFYEFDTSKGGVAYAAKGFVTRPWEVAVGGVLKKPKKFDLDELLKFQLEERVYRLRCVEGWSMVIPWVGFPLGDLLKRFQPAGTAKFVEFTTVLRPQEMVGQRIRFPSLLAWPYTEGLRSDEAMHPLAIIAVGLYGEALLNQNGAPLRLLVPWKYGFKSVKSIVRISFVRTQ